MSPIWTLALLTVLACAAPGGQVGRSPRDAAPGLKFALEARDTYAAGTAVVVRFSLASTSPEPLWILEAYTPLEGLRGDIFRLTRDGQVVPYNGPMVKRGDPLREDYSRLEAGGSLKAEVDLAKGYDLGPPGTYRAELVGRIHDVARDGEEIPRSRDRFRGVDVPGNAVTFRVEPQ